jgi:hypothetical protein
MAAAAAAVQTKASTSASAAPAANASPREPPRLRIAERLGVLHPTILKKRADKLRSLPLNMQHQILESHVANLAYVRQGLHDEFRDDPTLPGIYPSAGRYGDACACPVCKFGTEPRQRIVMGQIEEGAGIVPVFGCPKCLARWLQLPPYDPEMADSIAAREKREKEEAEARNRA